jgi:hypothetical protein
MTNGWGECFCDWYDCPRCYVQSLPPPEPKIEQYKFPDDIIDTIVQLFKFGCKEKYVLSCYDFYHTKGFLTEKQISVIKKICDNYITVDDKVYTKK